MPHKRVTSLLALSLILGFASLGIAQTPPKPDAPKPPTPPAAGPAKMEPPKADAAKSEPAKAPPKDQEIDDVVKDFTKMPGLFTFYRLKKGLSDQLYVEIPEAMLNHWLLLQATASTGTMNASLGIFHGLPLNDVPFQFRIVDSERVQMYSPDFENRAPNNVEAQRALDREYSGELIYGFDIKARQKSRKSILIDVSTLFKSDVAEISESLRAGPFGSYGLDPSGTYIDSVKVLPDNAVVRTMYKINFQGPPVGFPRSLPFAVSYNLSALPDDGYKPRISDTRVGYFTTHYLDQSDAHNEDPNVNYIARFRLEKADPKAALSLPKKPIVFYIDNAMPKEYRPYATAGLLAWNKAFEEIGFKDAIVVKQMPDDADWDIADVRYNVVRWMVNLPFSIALFRVNPLTGEVLNASINFDAAFATENWALDLFDTSHPSISQLNNSSLDPTQPAPVVSSFYSKFPGSRDLLCDLPGADADDRSLGLEAIDALASDLAPEALLSEKLRSSYESIQEVATHEIGHCLGLRHNFAGSTYLSNDQLGDSATTHREGVTASVMDYNPMNLAAIGKKDVSYFSTVVGKYDKWAIKYGYTPIDSATPAGELYQLRQIASHANEPGLAYEDDSIADGYDPMVRRFDMSSDPLEWCRRMVVMADKAIAGLEKRHPKDGESDWEFTKRYLRLYTFEVLRPVSFANTFIGGTVVHKSFRGDPGVKPSILPVPRADQQRAFDLIAKAAFMENSPTISAHAASKFTTNPNEPGNDSSRFDRLFPVLDYVTARRQAALDSLFLSTKLSLIVNNEARSPDTLPLASLFGQVKHDLWTELDNGHAISAVRRSLQKRHIEWLSLILEHKVVAPGDAVSLAYVELHDLEPQLRAAAAKQADPMQRAHLLACIAQVRDALEARTVTE